MENRGQLVKSVRIKTINGKSCVVTRTPCDCVCHTVLINPEYIHIKACCDDGWVEEIEEIKKSWDT